MKTSKKIKIIAGSILGLAMLLFAVLIVHIAVMVRKQAQEPDATIQMARADFRQPVDSANAQVIQNKIGKLKGVKSTYFNLTSNILIYTFDNKENTAQNIYNSAIKNEGFASVRHVVSAADMNKGCPAMNPHSFYGRLSILVARVVN